MSANLAPVALTGFAAFASSFLASSAASDMSAKAGWAPAYDFVILVPKSSNTPASAVILFDKAAGHSMVIDDNTYTVIEERDVVVVL